MLKQVRLTGKIVGAIVATLVITSAISFWITQRRINQQAEEAFRDKVRQVTGMASTTKDWFASNINTMVPGGEFKALTQVPVVIAWSVAQQYAKTRDMEFSTPSLTRATPRTAPTGLSRERSRRLPKILS